MSQTLREMRELRRLDPSNHTLRFNRTRREAGMHGDIDDSPGPQTFVALVGWGIVGALVLWVFLVVVLG